MKLLRTAALATMIALPTALSFQLSSLSQVRESQRETRVHCERCKVVGGVTRPCKCRTQVRSCAVGAVPKFCSGWKDI